MIDSDKLTERRQAAHDIRSSLRAIGIYSDLLTAQVRSGELELAQIDRLASAIGNGIEELADRIDEYNEELLELEEHESAT